MKSSFVVLLGLGAAIASGVAADFNPVSVTGFNFDAVVENNASAGVNPNVYTGAAQSLDATGNTFYEALLPGAAGSTGLPTSETVTASSGGNNFTFNLASYGNNTGLVSNALQIAPGPGGHAFISLTLSTPTGYSAMAFLGFSTEAQPATAIGDVLLTFTDSSTSTYSNVLDIPDWYFGTATVSHPEIFNATGRVRTTDGLYNQNLSGVTASDGGKLFASVINLSVADQAKTVESVGFRITSSTASDRTYIMGVSAVPEPTTLVLTGLATLPLLLRRRRR
jgi:hypothetical protein